MPDPADELYGLPLEEFTAARNALAKELARQGDKETAAAIKGLAKPTKAAWALNQVARQQPGTVDLLLEAGAQLREAQRLALEGDASRLRAATRAEQEHLNRLADAAATLAGPGAGDRLRATLRAAATDAEVGAALRRGRLVTDVESSGFGLEGLSAGSAPGGPPGGTAAAARREREREHREAVREAERLRKRADAEANRARRMQDEAGRMEQQATEARRKAEEAAARAAEAFRTAEEAAERAGI